MQNNDELNVGISTDKQVYTQREKVNLKFNIMNSAEPSTGHFSVAVINESKAPVNDNEENTILTNLLLTSDLKGYVEQPNYYFSNISDKTNAELDMVMLTNGYRRFEWKKLLSDEYPISAFKPENGLEISGTAKSPGGKPLSNSTVALLSMNGGPVLTQLTNENGAFRFDNLTFMDSTHFLLKTTNEKLKNNTRLFYNADKPIPVTGNTDHAAVQDDVNKLMAVYLENKKIQMGEIAKYGPIKGILLKEVKVKDVKSDNDYPSSNLGGPGHADQVIHRSEFQGSGSFSDMFTGRLIGVNFWGPPYAKKAYLSMPVTLGIGHGNPPMLVVVDGVKYPPDSLGPNFSVDEINVNDIETVEVLRNSSASIYGAMGGSGVLVITTRNGADDPQSKPAARGILPITPKGYYKAREFYSPKYDHQANNFNRKDLRTTIYWKPELVTDKDGNASFNYYNADGAGMYRVVIEGIDDNGNLGRQVYRYKVE